MDVTVMDVMTRTYYLDLRPRVIAQAVWRIALRDVKIVRRSPTTVTCTANEM